MHFSSSTEWNGGSLKIHSRHNQDWQRLDVCGVGLNVLFTRTLSRAAVVYAAGVCQTVETCAFTPYRVVVFNHKRNE